MEEKRKGKKEKKRKSGKRWSAGGRGKERILEKRNVVNKRR